MHSDELRDFFAGLALLGLLMSDDFREEDEGIDVTAYRLADAMLESRSNTKE